MKKLILLLALAMAATTPSAVSAQRLEDVVYLKNGSIVRGIVVEQVPGESLKITTREGTLLVFKVDEVQKMTREIDTRRRGRTGHYSDPPEQTPPGKFNKPRGYLGIVEAGTGIGLHGPFASHRSYVTMINGYRVAPGFAIGGGVGSEVYLDYNGDIDDISIPFFLHLRSDFSTTRISPYVAFNVGYSVSLLDGYFTGMLIEPSAGVSFNVGRRFRMMVGLGYALNRALYDLFIPGSDIVAYDRGLDGALKLKFGFSF